MTDDAAKFCECSIDDLMRVGCTCGAFVEEQERKETEMQTETASATC